ncbi:metalloregulator ArsR/SmtB family transcription factor [Paenibacillus macerans]|uniref:Bacterial regulatory, arsR family protein n=1 Tax=Paenibacillus macerans TaxID=44252 RepID=A0A090ZF21_PAEMA|nr:metalloregulator ArsR/SmtB family transcription factor [Paenibacillus macerans]KFN08830.1 bacterial regulatory, arsR family protein [Paenibacillus macerans]MCY7562140.1 metalloregulator ArsR/SmtB family transcription factor [Paenibacillus macerans]MEC0140524.1 metalloregulator ArsR/SmtB family transcription factor [Paenibacillus macerans]MEC0153770.1 metalloregulator ArsR/SmtB family transcription factor [Paenibacillus macerans]MEC0330666.1 metalloregulator ArsR/SmtB family transcription fa
MDNNFKAYQEAADILKALAHPVRLCIVKGLLDKKDCNVTYMQECLKLPQSTVSQHLQKLRNLGIVEAERSGLEVKYRIANDHVKKLIRTLFEEEQ